MKSLFQQLQPFGWNEFFDSNFRHHAAHGFSAGRISFESRERYRACTANGEISATISGKLRFAASSRSELPAVGDWVALEIQSNEQGAVIHSILPRKSSFIRKAAGKKTEEQVIAANIDSVFVMTSLNQDFNLRRLERYLAIAWNSGATPVIVLTKSDLCDDIDTRIAEVNEIAVGTPVHAVSVRSQTGLDALTPYLSAGQTVVLVGSSGVGKSTLMNHLAGQILLPVQEIREHDDHGRHTTTHRQLFLLPSGGLILDTPGIRELQLWETDVDPLFADIQEFAVNCYFKDCQHQHEPDCAVRRALEEGTLEPERFASYQKLQKELRYIAIKKDVVAQQLQRKKWKKLTRYAAEHSRQKRN